MDPLVGIIGGLLLLLLIPLLLWRRGEPSRSQQDDDASPLSLQQASTRRMRRRNVVAGSSSSSARLEIDQEEIDESIHYAVKTSKKKEMKKQEKESRKQAEEVARDMRRQKHDRYAEMSRRKDEEREAEELRKEEESRAQREREEAVANAEFDKWKDAFTVETEGTLEQELEEESRFLLNKFVDYIKKHKYVALEDLAAEFRLRTQDVIDRIYSLEQIGRLSGVMDDRGKYIYISLEEMEAVAEYIKKQGRVSIAHLAGKSNEFIDLEPKLIEEEALARDALFPEDKSDCVRTVLPIAVVS
eukprot:c21376_g1_i1 orf=246-1148(-)